MHRVIRDYEQQLSDTRSTIKEREAYIEQLLLESKLLLTHHSALLDEPRSDEGPSRTPN